MFALLSALWLFACGPPLAPDPADRVPGWQLEDVQPASARYKEEYGPEEFAGSPLLVALLAGESERAQDVARGLEALYRECLDEGHNIAFLIINRSGDAAAEALAGAVSFPVFQDRAEVDAWRRHGGRAFDVFVYAPDGAALEKLNLSSEAGEELSKATRARLKAALTVE